MNVQEKIEFVKKQIGYHERQTQINSHRGFADKANFHKEYIEKFEEILSDYENLDDDSNSEQRLVQSDLFSSPVSKFGDISDLPQELLDELSISEGDKYSMQICNVLESAGKPLNIDQILIGLYRKHNRLEKRTPLTTKLYRMTKAEEIYSVPNKKGVYSLLPVLDEEDEEMAT